jgi:hypothetical protein
MVAQGRQEEEQPDELVIRSFIRPSMEALHDVDIRAPDIDQRARLVLFRERSL